MGAKAGLDVPSKRTRAMGLFSKDIKTINDLFMHQLRDIYYAEQELNQGIAQDGK